MARAQGRRHDHWHWHWHWLGVTLLALCAACSLNERPDGGLVVQVDTDVASPKDLDSVSVAVSQPGNALVDETPFALGPSATLLPLSLEVGYPGNREPALITVVGYRAGQRVIERTAVTPIPEQRWALLHVKLHYLCMQDPEAADPLRCDPGQTCIQGSCADANVAEAALVEVERQSSGAKISSAKISSAKISSATTAGAQAGCFDVTRCFGGASEAELTTDCAFAINEALDPAQLNVALKLMPGERGTCDATGCYVPFDQNAEGYTFAPGRVVMPAAVCGSGSVEASRPAKRVVFSNTCDAKLASSPICPEGAETNEDGSTANTADTSSFTGGLAVGDACGGARIRTCGMCGNQARQCDAGNWGEFGACMQEGECTPNQTRPCGSQGVQSCGGDCRWGACLGQTCTGSSSQACERCGTQARACQNGIWDLWSACVDQGACMPGDTQACGSGGTQACGGNCEWGPCGEQVCPGAPTEQCGMCGTRSRECDPSSGQWSAFGACMGEGVCAPNQTQSCGRGGTRTCGGNCQWGAACSGQRCEGEASMACGNCGTRTRTCDSETGQWSDWSACSGEGVCRPDQTRGCGRGGTQVCNGSCNWDSECTGQSCVGAASQPCGNCGVQTRACDSTTGLWSAWSACSDQGACRPNSVRMCGSGGTQLCGNDCEWEQACNGQVCSGATSRSCGNCGVQSRSCDTSTGQLSGWGGCLNEGACAAGATRTCGSQGTNLCGDDCQWERACTGQVCAEPAERACGACGTQTSTCDPDTGRATWSLCRGEGQCQPGETQACGSMGIRTCASDCRWPTTCSMQMCPGEPPTRGCGRCGTQASRCDPDTGTWSFLDLCTNEGPCAPGETRKCGTNGAGTQVCGPDCRWPSLCTYECRDPLTRVCGNCGKGRQTGTCDTTTGQVTYGACEGGGACRAGDTMTCRVGQDTGMLVCGTDCEWPTTSNACMLMCREPLSRVCGNCDRGTQTGTCDPTTGRVSYGACSGGGACGPGDEQTCSTSAGTGIRRCSSSCEWPAACEITTYECTEPPTIVCGQCGQGVRRGTCNTTNGKMEYGACVLQGDDCTPRMTERCTTAEGSGTRTCDAMSCNWATCIVTERTCAEPPSLPCGKCNQGTMLGTCNTMTGKMVYGACQLQGDDCEPGTTQACRRGEKVGQWTCNAQCNWPTIEDCKLECAGKEGDRCGACGTLGPCNSSDGTQECRSACTTGATEACTNGELVGQRTCDGGCWGTCVVDCPGNEGDRCDDACGKLGKCDSTTGKRECLRECNPSAPAGECTLETGGTGTRACLPNACWDRCTTIVN